jgi:hypothetical protein
MIHLSVAGRPHLGYPVKPGNDKLRAAAGNTKTGDNQERSEDLNMTGWT